MSLPNNNGLIIINETNLNTGIVNKEHALIYSAYYWHKIYVQNALNYSRDFVLKTIMNAIHPLDFIPVCFSVEGEFITFLLKNCGAAIGELCRRNLTIPHPDEHKKLPAFKIAIVLKHSHASELNIEIQNNIMAVLKRRYNATTKTLNLDSFSGDPDLNEFCPLSQPKLMYFVLHLSRELVIEHLRLGCNEIEMLKPLEALNGEKNLKTLISLNLRKNSIKSLEYLNILSNYPITEITLEDNPICKNMTEQEYIKLIRKYLPKVTKIDDCIISTESIMSPKRNFLCLLDGHMFVDKFLEHFFSLYDSSNRALLENCYHRDAMFSITTHHVGNNKTVPNNKLFEYLSYSRNLKTMSDLSKRDECLFFGSSSIARLFSSFPACEHDPHSFTVDLMLYSSNAAVIVITGVFKELGKSLLESDNYFSFIRTFVLTSSGGIEYKIINDMLHLTNVTNEEMNEAFKIVKVPKPICNSVPLPNSQSERNEVINALALLSGLKLEWAVKCLQEVDYNLKRALMLFMDLLQDNTFPLSAFDFKDDMNSQNAPHVPAIQERAQPINAMKVSNATATSTNRNSNATSSAAGEIKKAGSSVIQMNHIRDPIILSALKMDQTTQLETARRNLFAAADIILKKHTYALKLYKAIGKQFYKFKLLSEARKFLTDAMTNMPKAMGEELYSIFTLYEIELGDITVAENMILITAETYHVNKTVKFIGEYVAKLNPLFSKKMFEFVLISNLPDDKRRTIEIAYEKFKTNFKDSLKPFPVLDGNANNPVQPTTAPSASAPAPTSTSADNHDDSAVVIIEDEPPSKFSGARSGHKNLSYEEFREKFLTNANVLLAKTKSPELDVFLKIKDPNDASINNAISELFEKYKGDLYIMKELCRKLWDLKLKTKVKECLALMKECVTHRYLNAILTYYKLLEDYEQGKPLAGAIMAIDYMKTCSKIFNLVPFFEELLLSKEEIKELVFRACLGNAELSPGIKKIVVLYYKYYCMKIGSADADEIYDELFSKVIIYYHPKEFPVSETVQGLRANKVWNRRALFQELCKFSQDHQDDIGMHIEITKICFQNGLDCRAREIRNKFKGFDDVHTMLYKAAYLYYESKYGKRDVAKVFMKKIESNFNTACVTLLLNSMEKAIFSIRKILEKFAKNPIIIMNPLALRVLYQYHKEIINDYNIDLLTLMGH